MADNATAQQLGITQLIQQQTSYFYGSPAARIQNIQTAAARFDGVLVAPGETFSMGQTLGDVSLNNGYTLKPLLFMATAQSPAWAEAYVRSAPRYFVPC